MNVEYLGAKQAVRNSKRARGAENAATKLIAVLIFAVFCTRHPEAGAPELPVGELRASWGHEWSAPTCKICAHGANGAPNLKL